MRRNGRILSQSATNDTFLFFVEKTRSSLPATSMPIHHACTHANTAVEQDAQGT